LTGWTPVMVTVGPFSIWTGCIWIGWEGITVGVGAGAGVADGVCA